MRTLICLLPLCGACSLAAQAETVIDPGPSMLEVLTSLDEAVERSAAGDPQALEAWDRALDTFDRSVEPVLRERADPVEVLQSEYAFTRIRTALVEGRDAGVEVDALGKRLQAQLGSLRTVATR
jgi:predicted NBD/HSP70 family sugar kinase